MVVQPWHGMRPALPMNQEAVQAVGQEAVVFAEITDVQWEAIVHYLPQKKRQGRPLADDRGILNGILYVLCTNCAWGALPRRFGSSTTCWRRHLHWQNTGIWPKIAQIAGIDPVTDRS